MEAALRGEQQMAAERREPTGDPWIDFDEGTLALETIIRAFGERQRRTE